MEGYDKLGRPDWDTFWMGLCFVFAQKSLDSQTKCGCVAVGEGNTFLSAGYNSPPRGCSDDNIPRTRPGKYFYMRHAEENVISNAARTGVSLLGSTFYITGPSCHNCFGMMKNVGVKRIVYGDVHANCVGDESRAAIEELQKHNPIEVVRFENNPSVVELFDRVRSGVLDIINE